MKGLSVKIGLIILAVLITLIILVVLMHSTPGRGAAGEIGCVFVIAVENHNFTQPADVLRPQPLLGNLAAPFLNSLVTRGDPNARYVSYCAHYTNAGSGVHPSEGSYIWSECGTNFNPDKHFTVLNDTDPSEARGNLFTVKHLSGMLDAAGIPWKNYQEDVEYSPSPQISASGTLPDGKTNPYNGTRLYSYAVKHNPMAFFADTGTKNIYPISQLETDLADNKVGRYNWITPDPFNEMHSILPGGYSYHGVHYNGDQAAIAEGDHCLSILIPLIEKSQAFKKNGVIIIWCDETEVGDTAEFTLPEIIISPLAKGNAYRCKVPLSRSSDLKTMQEIFRLGPAFLKYPIPEDEYSVEGPGHFNTVAEANDFSDLFVPGAIPQGLPKEAPRHTPRGAEKLKVRQDHYIGSRHL